MRVSGFVFGGICCRHWELVELFIGISKCRDGILKRWVEEYLIDVCKCGLKVYSVLIPIMSEENSTDSKLHLVSIGVLRYKVGRI